MSGTVIPTQPVTIVSPEPSSIDFNPLAGGLTQNLAPFASMGWSGQQPIFPTSWPPTPVPGYQLPFAGASIPWKQWVQVLAVLPFVTDPPPCPVVVSRYPGLTNN